jgi:hypothetical protein
VRRGKTVLRKIISELRHHIPFTIVGAATGIVLVVIFVATGSLQSVEAVSPTVFYTLHPIHVVLSAAATTAMYRKHSGGGLLQAAAIGYVGSVGIATLSDSVLPYIGETLLSLPHAEAHIGFIERWWLVNPAALLGIAAGAWKPFTKVPHAGHVLISTWASLFHVIMALGTTVPWLQFVAIFIFLFIAVWLPVCLIDIVFPLTFARGQPAAYDR